MKKLTRLLPCLALLAYCTFSEATITAKKAEHAVSSDAQNQKMILYYINTFRMQHHLSPLKASPLIAREAQLHSKDMATHKMPFGHNGFPARIKHLYPQFEHCNGGAENVAYYKINSKKLVEGWLASSGHRRNIVGPYNWTGIGIAYAEKPGWAYFTQVFLHCDA